MNNNQNNLIKCAMEKIKNDQKFKPNCNVVIGPAGADGATGPTGPTGPTGDIGPTGPTDTYDYFFNKINRNYYSTKNIHHIKL